MKSSTNCLCLVIYVSLNDNENVRKCLNENIYRVGGLDLDWIGGGVLWEMYG